MDLSAFNTLKLISQVPYMVQCDHLAILHQWQSKAYDQGLAVYILGGGSNVVLPQQLDGVVIRVTLQGKAILRQDHTHGYLSAQAGENWHQFVLWTLKHGYTGLENLALIPGTVGAAPVQNIGAYGVEVQEYLDHVVVYDLHTGEHLRLHKTECAFGYRDSLFKQSAYRHRFLITEVVFRLPKTPDLKLDYEEIVIELDRLHLSPSPLHIAQAVMAIRQRKLPDPLHVANAGSFFKNPVVPTTQATALIHAFPTLPHYCQTGGHVKLAAGWMIEQAGWKGRRLGNVGMYEKQALVLVNYGGATAQEVLALSQAVQHDVQQQFGIMLEPEPVFW